MSDRFPFIAVVGIAVLLVPNIAQDLRAQRGPGGEGGGRGDRGSGGESFGPGRGGGFGPGGGFAPGGGFGPGGGGSFGGPGEFLQRLDQNGDGILSPEESQGRAAFIIQRFLPNVDPSRPIPLDQLRRALEQVREQREREGGFSRGGFRGDDRGGGGWDDRGSGGDSRNRSSPGAAEPEVPGFGVNSGLSPVPGFGSSAQLFAVAITDRDRSEAQRSLSRYDENRDGILDRNEISRGRWTSDPLQFDSNGDGRLTAAELEVRYARRRLDRESSSSDSSNRSALSSSSSRFEGPFRRDGERMSSGSRHNEPRRYEPNNSSKLPEIQVYRMSSAYDRLPAGLPDWFREKDADLDGQVVMAEFASSWTDQLASEFAGYDLDGDGVITPKELLKMKGASPSGTSSQSSTSGSTRVESRADLGAYLKYAEGVVKKYDKNGDGVLTSDEWGEMSSSPEPADQDGNGQITAEEYAAFKMK